MSNCIRHVAKKELGESKGVAPPSKDTLWWKEEVKKLSRTNEFSIET